MDIWGGCRGRGPTAKTMYWIIHLSALLVTTALDSRPWCDQNYSSWPVKNSLSSLVHTYLNISPFPLCPHCVHLASFMWWMLLGLPRFFAPKYISSASVYGYIYPLSESQSSSESVGKRIWPDHSEGPGLKPDWTWSPFSFSLFNVLSTNRMYFQP